MKSFVKTAVLVLFMVLAYCVVNPSGQIALVKAVGTISEDGRDMMMAKALTRAAEKFNEDLPKDLEDGLRIDSVEASGTELIYNHTFTTISSYDDAAYEIKESLDSYIADEVCATKEMELFLEGGVTISFLFLGSNNKEISKISVDKAKCDSIT